MADTVFLIFSMVALTVVILGFIAYMLNTNRIIKSQEQEITQLKRALHNERISNKEQAYITPKKPKFGDF